MTNTTEHRNRRHSWWEFRHARQPLPARGLPFPWHIQLPKLSAAVNEIQNNIQAPGPLIFGSALVAVTIAQQALIDVRKPNGQIVPSSLMLASIGNSGERKSAAEGISMKQIRAFQKHKKSEHQNRLKKWRVEHDIWKSQRNALLKIISNKASNGVSSSDEEERLLAHEGDEPIRPKDFKILYEDSTSEALFYGLHQNLPTAGLISSEGGGILGGSAINDLAKQNATWSGDTITVDRKSKPSFELAGVRLTVSLMVQESAFNQYMEKHGEAARGSGLWARFLVSHPASTQGTRFVKNETLSWEHQIAFNDRLNTLLEENTLLLEDPAAEKKAVQFTPEASERWFEVANAIEAEIRPNGRFENAGDHASKLADNIARMSAQFHWFEQFEGDISIETIELAISICFWYSDEFLRLFVPPPQEVMDAHELNEWLNNIQMHGQRYIRKNYIRQYCPNRLREKRRLQIALEVLQADGRILLLTMGRIAFVDLSPSEPYNYMAAQVAIVGQVKTSYT